MVDKTVLDNLHTSLEDGIDTIDTEQFVSCILIMREYNVFTSNEVMDHGFSEETCEVAINVLSAIDLIEFVQDDELMYAWTDR